MSDRESDQEMQNEEPKKNINLKEFVSTQEAKLLPKNLFVDSLQTSK